MSADLSLGDLGITINTQEGEPVSASFTLPDGSVVIRPIANGELNMRLGLGLGLGFRSLPAGGGGGGEDPGASTNAIAATVFTANTSTGQQTITTEDLGGMIPKAVLFFASPCTASETAVSNHGLFAVGGATTSAARAIYAQSESGTTHSRNEASTAIFYRSASADRSASFVGFVENGVTIDWTTAPASAHKIVALFFAGDDLSAELVQIDSVATTGTAVSASFEPELMFVYSALKDNTGVAASNAEASLGIVHNDGAGNVTQRAIASFADSGNWRTSVTADAAIIQTDRGAANDYVISLSAFSASGFTATASGTNGSQAASQADVHFALCLSWGGNAQIKVGTHTLPTSPGTTSKTGVGFQPEHLVFLTNTQTPGGGTAMALGVGYVDATNTFSVMRASAAQSIMSENSLIGLLEDSTQAVDYAATLASLDADGFTLNFSDAPAVADVWSYLAVRFGA